MTLDEKIDHLLKDLNDVKVSLGRFDERYQTQLAQMATLSSDVQQHEQAYQRAKGVFWTIQILWAVVLAKLGWK